MSNRPVFMNIETDLLVDLYVMYHNATIILRETNTSKCYTFSSGAGPEKIELRKRWNSLIGRKDFTPTKGQRVCSEHFPGGQKTYMNNLPIIVPKTTRTTIS